MKEAKDENNLETLVLNAFEDFVKSLEQSGMWTLKITRQFKKDMKKYQNKVNNIARLSVVLKMLQEIGHSELFG